MATKQKFFSVAAAAEQIGISRQRLWLYIRDKRCPAIGEGRSFLVSDVAIEAMKQLRAANGKKGGRPKSNNRKNGKGR